MYSKRLILSACFFLAYGISNELNAQVLDPSESPLDGVYTKSLDNPNRKPIPYTPLREADIMWSKRIWRDVDMREKINHAFYYPEKPDQGRKSFMFVIMEAINEKGSIQPYSAKGEDGGPNDMFNIPITPEEAQKQFAYTTVEAIEDEITGEIIDKEVENAIPLSEVTKFRIKEEVFFDKQRSVMETRILGIAPVVPFINGATGEVESYQEAFWIYFPEARRVFSQSEVYNRHNDVHRLTYDDLFWKRMFSSYVVKETNVYNRKVEDYKAPMDALLEAEQIEEKIFHREHDLWSY
jgi:gliding motility associated protien GldN